MSTGAFKLVDIDLPRKGRFAAADIDAAEKAGFRQRFIESSGLSGIDALSKNVPQNWKDLFSAALAPAKGAMESATAPVKHLGDILSAHKAGDKEGVLSSVSKFIDSVMPGAGNAQELSLSTIKDLQEGNVGALTGTATGLAAQLALIKRMSGTSDFKKLIYTGEVDAEGIPTLTKLARSVLHPTELPENVLRAAVPPTDEAIAAQKALKGEAFAKEFEKQYSEFGKAKEAGAANLEEQMKTAETARQKELAANERLKNIDAQSRMNRETQQAKLDAAAAKNAPAPSPFAGATSTTSPLGNLKLPEPGASATSATGGLPEGSPTPFVGKFTTPEASKIVSPLSPPPSINRTLVSYDRQLLVHMARGGDLNALRELIRNPGDIDVATAVPNSKYLMEAGAPSRIYGGPESTK